MKTLFCILPWPDQNNNNSVSTCISIIIIAVAHLWHTETFWKQQSIDSDRPSKLMRSKRKYVYVYTFRKKVLPPFMSLHNNAIKRKSENETQSCSYAGIFEQYYLTGRNRTSLGGT